MLKKKLFLLYVILLFAVPLFIGLGNDMVSKDDFHFKNWSYVYMKEFEAGNYGRLYVSVQPGVLTIYSNIVGFKGLYFAKDKLDVIAAEGKDFELFLHTAQKIPKSLAILVLGVFVVYLCKSLIDTKFALIFAHLLALEPYLVGQSRVIQTDVLPMYLGVLVLLLLIYFKRLPTYKHRYTAFVGILTGLAVIEKSLYFVLFVVVALNFLFRKDVRNFMIYTGTTLLTMFIMFPAFWGDFLFTLYRITIGSFIFGVQGLDTETFSYEKTHHVQSWAYYFDFLLHKVSEFVWFGIVLLVAQLRSWKKHVRKDHVLLIVFPVILFSILLIAEKKIGRYMIALFPYMMLLATLGYYKLFCGKKQLAIVLLTFLLGVRFFQLSSYFPDFLMYTNPLAPDTGFDNSREDFGTGRKKLAQHLIDVYGQDKKIYATDYTTLYLFYLGVVINKDDMQCDSSYDLIVTQSPTEKFTLYNDLNFYIYYN